MKAKDLLVYNEVTNYLKISNAKDKMNIPRRIVYYLKWRNISYQELMKSTNEESFFEQMVNEYTTAGSRSYAISITAVVRSFLRFSGVKVKAKHQLKEIWHFPNDEIMIKFLKFFKAKPTKKSASIALNDYCLFLKTTPSELLEEEISELDLSIRLLDFAKYIEQEKEILELTAWRKVNTIIKFYRKFKQIRVEFERSEKPRPIRKLYSKQRTSMITKDEMKQLLENADTRDKAILYGLWESGLTSTDLTNITYGQLKEFINIDEPNNVPTIAIFIHKRQKNNIEFFCAIGYQTLVFVSKWLRQRTSGLLGEKEQLTDRTILFSRKKPPHTKLNYRTINNLTQRLAALTGIRKLVPTDFRNTFYTKLQESGMDKDTREMLMGHTLGIAGHYNISGIEHYQKEYLKFFDVCFDLTIDNERVKNLEEENIDLKNRLDKLERGYKQLMFSFKSGKPIPEEDFTEEDLENFAYGYDK